MQAMEPVIPVILQRWLAQSSPHVTGHFPAEILNVTLPEEGAVYCRL